MEVKQTSKDYMNLEADWFLKMQEHYPKHRVFLCLAFGKRMYFYELDSLGEESNWKTRKIQEDKLPETIQAGKFSWVRIGKRDLANL